MYEPVCVSVCSSHCPPYIFRPIIRVCAADFPLLLSYHSHYPVIIFLFYFRPREKADPLLTLWTNTSFIYTGKHLKLFSFCDDLLIRSHGLWDLASCPPCQANAFPYGRMETRIEANIATGSFLYWNTFTHIINGDACCNLSWNRF